MNTTKAGDKKLREEYEHLKTMVDSTHVLLAYLDKDFNFIRVNKAYAAADDKEPSFFPGKNHFDLYPNEENEHIFQKVVNSGEPFFIRGKPFEYPQNPDRGTSYWDWSLIPIKKSEGKVDSLVFTLRDVTDREVARQKLKESNNRTKFYKDLLAHDMRNVLFVVQSSVELMEHWGTKTLSSDQVQEMINRIKEQVERGTNLISNVQKLSEVKEEKRTIKKIDVENLLDKTLSEVVKGFNNQDITIKKEYNEEPLTTEAGDLLVDAFENILINGIIHNENDKKQLWIETSVIEGDSNQYIKIEFKDNGNGIPDKNKEKVFQHGFKHENSTGMGLGLSLVKEIIEGYDGKVWMENRIEDDYTKGSNFIILLKRFE
jgi:PAS domain S-box-containing protein